MPITKEQWQQVQNKLQRYYGFADFRLATGEKITVSKEFISENRMALVVWIDGQRNLVWGYPQLKEFNPLVKQVWCRKTRQPLASSVRRISAMKGGKAYLRRKENAYLKERKEYWEAYFSTAAALVRQFSKIEGIELFTLEAENGGQ